MSNKFLIGVGIALIIFLIITYSPTKTPEPVKKSGNFEALLRDQFMTGCLGETSTYEYCSCTYSELRSDNTVEELEKLSDMSEGEMLDWIVPYVEKCVDKL